jgi:hypothetical protein
MGIFTEPLLEKTTNKPVKGELLVNTETGHISVKSSNSISSATKSLQSDFDLQVNLVSLIEDTIENLDPVISDLGNNFNAENSRTNDFQKRLNALKILITEMKKSIVVIQGINQDNAYQLWLYYGIIKNLIDGIFSNLNYLYASERSINELTYIDSLLSNNKNFFSSEQIKIKSRMSDVTSNVNSRVDRTTYNNFRSDIINRYNNLRKNGKVQSINFK